MNTQRWSKALHQAVPFVPAVLVVAALGWCVSFEVLLAVLGTAPMLVLVVPGVWWRRSSRPPSPWEHLESRMPVWSALSEMYLDTELDEQDHARIAGVLGRSGYDVHQLEEILYREVHPVVAGNLMSGVGEWAGFDSDWLMKAILMRDRPRWGVALVFAKCMTQAEWQLIRLRVVALLGEGSTPHAVRVA